jgi:hypothetical protein
MSGNSGAFGPLPRNMLWLCHISDMDMDYAEWRCPEGEEGEDP